DDYHPSCWIDRRLLLLYFPLSVLAFWSVLIVQRKKMNSRSILGLVRFVGMLGVLLVCQNTSSGQQYRNVRLNRTIELLDQGKSTFGIFSKDRSLDNARKLAKSN